MTTSETIDTAAASAAVTDAMDAASGAHSLLEEAHKLLQPPPVDPPPEEPVEPEPDPDEPTEEPEPLPVEATLESDDPPAPSRAMAEAEPEATAKVWPDVETITAQIRAADIAAITLRANIARALEILEPEEPPPPPDQKQWWMDRGGPSLSGRPFRSGTFAVMGPSLKTWAAYMGCPPEISGGNCRTYGPAGRADTWDKVVNTQMELHINPQTKDAVLGLNGLHKQRTWLVIMFTTLPMGAPLDELIAAAKGQRKDKHKRMGENARRILDKNGRDHTLTIARPNWEFNKRTAFAIGSGKFPNYLLAGGSVEMYNDHMRQFARAFWDGYGYEMPLALSPAYEDGPNVPHVDYGRYLDAGVYKLACGSVHPNAQRVATQDAAWRMVFGLRTGNYTPGLIIECAKKYNIPVAFLEHSCPPEANAVKPNIKHLAFAYTQFGRLCNRPDSNVAFICGLGSGMVSETRMKSMGEPINTQWAMGIKENRKWFGKKV